MNVERIVRIFAGAVVLTSLAIGVENNNTAFINTDFYKGVKKMGKKYFTAFCNMNSTDLRANLFYHSCLVFLEADCDENQEIILPMRAVNAYGFYGHPIPSKKSFFEEPFTFLCQQVGINFRLRGSFGEWKRENIHDLSYGRGLTGRLFEMNSEQFNTILDKIHITIEIKN